MTTVIRAIGANFTAANLPVINDFLRDGLVAAYRPNNSLDGLKDLSGNDNHLVKIGSPVFTANSVIGDGLNALTTNLLEPLSVTYTAVFKMPSATSSVGGFVVGCYDEGEQSGTSIFNVVNGSSIDVYGSSYTETSAGSGIYENISINPETVSGENYLFVAWKVDSSNEQLTLYIPTLSIVKNIPIGTRKISSRKISTTNKIEIMSNPNKPTWESKVHVAEVLIYNKALSTEQISEQYQKSKSVMANIGIII